ncbi:uncharacterized protein LOC103308839 [Acyrthosiphon pisum]|uniref:ATP-dependent DNA helicase n=1 Tax=Acyrthosiphon pisum TaxID=7029 RepID=A0A8R2B4C7_ACYPI|nr:uncharacterized protein LOC103308839 [Acyrthosiphon pisum]|eukprot:XP_008181178.1 PREDICTED: uncharacterized protein LOC103308839 [Acyrthosiphon pisum]
MVVFGIADPNANDEVMKFQLGRYVSFYLENGQRVYFTEANAAQRAERPPATTLTNFFSTCESDPFARTLLYSEIPHYYTCNAASKNFQCRKKGDAVAGFSDVYSGPTSFNSLRTVDGVLCATFWKACQCLNLLENNSHWDLTLADTTVSAQENQIRTLFAVIIATCHPSNPNALWEKYKDEMIDDILHRVQALVLIDYMCVLMCGSLLSTLGMPAPNRSTHAAFNLELPREKNYDRDEQAERVRKNVPLLNAEQKNVYDSLMKVVDDGTGGIYFFDAPGGTGKTFVISLILAKIRSISQIALAVASSCIAATLLEGGRTAHSALKLPMNLLTVDKPTCTTTKNSVTAKLMRECKIIIWDECTMAHKLALKAVNRTMKYLRGDSRRFGGAMILLSGDFRQTLPAIPKSTLADEINACLKSSFLWWHVKKLKFTTNMRVALQNDPSAAEFSRQLLAVGNGQIPIDVFIGLISIPANFCEFTSSKEELITKVFPSFEVNYNNLDWMSERAILAARNKDVDSLNFTIQSEIAGELRSYESVDSTTDENEAVNYLTEFLNSLDVPGTPPHNLQVKVGSIIIMLRNLNPPKLCNDTRLSIKKLMNNALQSKIIKGNFKGEEVLIPRISIIPTDIPFQFKRIQFPVRLAFATTINKSQGQSLECKRKMITNVQLLTFNEPPIKKRKTGDNQLTQILKSNCKLKMITNVQLLTCDEPPIKKRKTGDNQLTQILKSNRKRKMITNVQLSTSDEPPLKKRKTGDDQLKLKPRVIIIEEDDSYNVDTDLA